MSRKGLCALLLLLSVVLSGALVVGCSKMRREESNSAATNCTENVYVGGVATNATGKTLLEMAPDDVLVSVNGVTVTKRQLQANVERVMRRLEQKPNVKKNQLTATARMMFHTYVPGFVSRQLLLQEARRSKVLTGAALASATEKWIAKAAVEAGTSSPTKYLEKVAGGAEALRHDAEEAVLIEAVVATNVLPKVVVSERFLKATIEAIKAENQSVDATNEMYIARLKSLREQIVAGADFGRMADIHSQCKRSGPGNNGYWGEFERRDFLDSKMRDAIFSLKPGEMSDVLEDDEGFHLVKMLAHKNGLTNAVSAEVRVQEASLAHILIRREPALEMSVPEDLKKQLFEQIKQREIEKYLTGLREKADIRYPNGTNFWRKGQSRGRGVLPVKK